MKWEILSDLRGDTYTLNKDCVSCAINIFNRLPLLDFRGRLPPLDLRGSVYCKIDDIRVRYDYQAVNGLIVRIGFVEPEDIIHQCIPYCREIERVMDVLYAKILMG